MGIKQGIDSLGNAVYTSSQFHEIGLQGEVLPAHIVLSPDGQSLVRKNPGLLRDIAQGTIKGEYVGEGDEGIVYRVVLQTHTGPKPFAVKYTFPIESVQPDTNRVVHSYTPRVDDMRLMQWAQKNLPYRFQYVIPLIATNDIHVAPYLPDSISADLLQQILNDETPISSAPSLFIAPLKQLLSQGVRNRTSAAFGVSRELTRSLAALSRDLNAATRTRLPFPEFSAKGALFEFGYRPDNVLLPFPALDALVRDLSQGVFGNPISWNEKDPQYNLFQKRIQECCWFIEMMINRDDVKKAE